MHRIADKYSVDCILLGGWHNWIGHCTSWIGMLPGSVVSMECQSGGGPKNRQTCGCLRVYPKRANLSNARLWNSPDGSSVAKKREANSLVSFPRCLNRNLGVAPSLENSSSCWQRTCQCSGLFPLHPDLDSQLAFLSKPCRSVHQRVHVEGDVS